MDRPLCLPPLPLPRAGKALSLLIVAGAAFQTGDARAATLRVTNCNDSGSGSLRSAVAAAVSGDTVDLTGLSCGRILLTSGEIVVPQRDLSIVGRSRSAMLIDGGGSSRLFRHDHIGRFRISHATLAFGRVEGDGGCIHSEFGEVELFRTRVHHCTAVRPAIGLARGGAVYARVVLLSSSAMYDNVASGWGTFGGGIFGGTIRLYRSQLYGNRAHEGGGIASNFNLGEVVVTYSLVHRNQARFRGAGIYAVPVNTTINKSTISANVGLSDDSEGGGIYQYSAGPLLVIDSTISGNRAGSQSAIAASDIAIYNSTVAFNVETFECQAAVLSTTLQMESTIAARNTCMAGVGFDVQDARGLSSHNLVERARFGVSRDTIVADPRLAPLADNGGPTRTHMLLGDSPAIDRGSNVLDRAFDQRGSGFPRERGAAPDIGAVER